MYSSIFSGVLSPSNQKSGSVWSEDHYIGKWHMPYHSQAPARILGFRLVGLCTETEQGTVVGRGHFWLWLQQLQNPAQPKQWCLIYKKWQWLFPVVLNRPKMSPFYPNSTWPLLSEGLPANAGDSGDAGSIPGLGRSLGVGNGNQLQYSCCKNPMDRGTWQAMVHGDLNSQTQLSMHTHTHRLRGYSILWEHHVHERCQPHINSYHLVPWELPQETQGASDKEIMMGLTAHLPHLLLPVPFSAFRVHSKNHQSP